MEDENIKKEEVEIDVVDESDEQPLDCSSSPNGSLSPPSLVTINPIKPKVSQQHNVSYLQS